MPVGKSFDVTIKMQVTKEKIIGNRADNKQPIEQLEITMIIPPSSMDRKIIITGANGTSQVMESKKPVYAIIGTDLSSISISSGIPSRNESSVGGSESPSVSAYLRFRDLNLNKQNSGNFNK